MTLQIQKTIDWFFAEKFNGNITKSQAYALQVVALGMMLDTYLEIGSSNGLSALMVKSVKNPRTEIIEDNEKKLENTKKLLQKCGISNVNFLKGKVTEMLKTENVRQYDLVFINHEEIDLFETIETLRKHLIPDAVVIAKLNDTKLPDKKIKGFKEQFVAFDMLFLKA